MNRVLSKRLTRDVKSNFARYLALFLMIAMGLYIIVGMVGAAETVISQTAVKNSENNVEDGEFTVFLPLTNEQETELHNSGADMEKMFSIDIENDNGAVIRLMKNRSKINLNDLDSGRIAKKNGEVVLEKRYCAENGISVGDTVTINKTDLLVTGIGSTPDYDLPVAKISDTAESSMFGIAFVTDEQYEKIKEDNSLKAEEYTYAYRLNGKITDNELKNIIKDFEFDYNNVEDKYFKETIADTIGRKSELQDGVNELLDVDIDNLTVFVKASENPRIAAAAGDMYMTKVTGLAAGVIVMILFTYVISVFVIHQIQRESSVIGALYALGAKEKDLIIHYITLPTIITFFGGIVGALLGFSKIGIENQMQDCYEYFSVPNFETIYPAYLIIYSVFMPCIVSIIVNYIVINKRLSQSALSLIRNEQNTGSYSKINLGKTGFIRRFQIRQMLREMRTGLTVVFAMIICLTIFMLAMNCYVLCNNISSQTKADSTYEYMYMLKYPESIAPENSEAVFSKSLSKTYFGYTLDVNIMGIDDDNKYFDVNTIDGKNSLIIGSAVAQKYGVKTGDKLTLTDSANDMDYAFTIEGIANYSIGLTAFMDIDSMRELFGEDKDYYNVLLSDEALDIDQGRIYSVTTKEDIERSANVFVELMMPMVTMLSVASVIIFCVVMFLMLNVMIDRSSFGISLMKIFGFKIGEIRKLYLNGNLLMVAVGAIVGIPLSKKIMDMLYPVMIANIGCGMDLEFTPLIYVGIFAGIMAVYFVINAMLVRKLKKISPADVLKNRE